MTSSIPHIAGSTKSGFRLLGSLFAVLALLFASSGCRSVRPESAQAVPQGTYYTKFGIRLNGNSCPSTNYRSERNLLLPINTEVELMSTRRNRFKMQLPGGRAFTFDYNKKHSGGTAQSSFDSFFSTESTDLSAFTAEEVDAIEKGQPMVGMTRDTVLTAIGPPPASGTLLLEGNVWKYWNGKFNRPFYVYFGDDGRVSSIGN